MAALDEHFGDAVQAELKLGTNGVFDVVVDGDYIFRKWDEHRFPTNREIVSALKQRLGK